MRTAQRLLICRAVSAVVEMLEKRQLLSMTPPTIGSFSVLPASIAPRTPVTLTATNVTDVNGPSAVGYVEFFLESNGVAGFQGGSDSFEGQGVKSGTTWTLSNVSTIGLTSGTHTWYAVAGDISGNNSAAVAASNIITPAPTVITANYATATYGQTGSIAVSALVASPYGNVNEGTVTFSAKQGSTTLATAVSGTASFGSVSATLNIPGLGAGSYQIYATYNPVINNPQFLTSITSTPGALTVYPQNVTPVPTYVFVNSASAVYGQTGAIAVSASVVATNITVNEGTVTFTLGQGAFVEGTAVSGTVSGSAANATINASGLGVGTYYIYATYNAATTNPQFFPSTANSIGVLTVSPSSVTAAPTVTTVSPVTAAYGQTGSIAASALVTSAGTTVNEGTVTFTIQQGSTILAMGVSGTVSGGVANAILNAQNLNAGTYQIFATYNPASTNPQFLTSTANSPGPLTVSPATLTVTAFNSTRLQGYSSSYFANSITGFVGSDTVAVVSGTALLSTPATATSPAGTYPIIPTHGTLASANYTFAFVNGSLTVTPAPTPSATIVSLTGSGAFSISYNASTQQYSFTGGNSPSSAIAAASISGFTFVGGGANDSLTITSGDPILLNDAGSDGTSLAISISAGAAIGFNATEHLGSLSINPGATASMVSKGQVLVTSSLSIAGSTDAWIGGLDLGSNDLVVHGGSLPVLSDQAKSGFDNGQWNGPGISSSTAASNTSHLTALGVISNLYNGSAFLSSLDGQSVVSTDVLVKYTYYGDANLDGKVDGSDYSRVDSGYIIHATGWFNGDFNYDGTVNGSDYTLIDNAFNTQGPPITVIQSAPPSFQVGANETVAENAPPQYFAGWATNINSGVTAPNQSLSFSASNNNNSLFSAPPLITADGSLSFTPAVNASGSATVTVNLTNNSNLTGKNASSSQTFTINVNGIDQALRTVLADYDLVRNTVAFQAYCGEMKGPTATAQTKEGNAWDQAVYLQQLLQSPNAVAEGISAQLVSSSIEVPGPVAAEWLGTTDQNGLVTPASISAAFNILNQADLLTSVSGTTEDNVVFYVRSAWVMATADGSTLRLDPSFKYSALQPGLPSVGSSVPFSFSQYTSTTDPTLSASVELPYEYYEKQLVAPYLSSNYPGKTIADIPHTGPIIPTTDLTAPSYPYSFDPGTPVSSFNESDKHRFTMSVATNTTNPVTLLSSQTLDVPDVSLESIVLTYGPSTITNDVTPELVINGATIVVGTPIPVRTSLNIYVTPIDPETAGADAIQTFQRVAGQEFILTLNAHQYSPALLTTLQTSIISAEQAYALGSTTATTAAVADSVLEYAAMRYWFDFDSQNEIIDNITSAVLTNNFVGIGSATNNITPAIGALIGLDQPTATTPDLLYTNVPKNILIDMPGVQYSAAPLDGTDIAGNESEPRYELVNANASALENQVIEEVTNAPSISTVKGLQIASANHINILTFVPGAANSTSTAINNALKAGYSANPSAWITPIINAVVNQGFTVTIPATTITENLFTGEVYSEEKYSNSGAAFGEIISDGVTPAHGGSEDDTPEYLPEDETVEGAARISAEQRAGDPIGLSSGNVTCSETDVSLPNFGQPITFDRQYNSYLSSTTLPGGFTADSGLGVGWTSNYSDSLTISNSSITWNTVDGHAYAFNLVNGVYQVVTPSTLSGTLTFANGVYTYTDKDGSSRKFEVFAGNPAAQLIQISDRNNNILTITHDSATGRINSVSDSQNSTYGLTFVYDGTGHLSKVQDSTGRIWVYNYSQLSDGRYYLTKVVSPSDGVTPGRVTTYSYYDVTRGPSITTDASRLFLGLLSAVTEIDTTNAQTNGTQTTTFSYYPDRHGFRVTDPQGNSTEVTYELFRHTAQFTDERNNITTTIYDPATGLTTQQVNPDQTSDIYSYSANHDLITSHTNPFGDTTTYNYDYGPNDAGAGVGNLLQTVDSFTGTVTSYKYESAAKFYQLASVTVTAGGVNEVTQYTHDNHGNTLSMTDAGNDLTTTTYGSRGQVLSRTAPNGSTVQPTGNYTTNFTYNPVGEILTTSTAGLLVNGQPATTTDTYDSHYALASVTDPTGVVTAYTNDLLGRRISQTRPDPDGAGPLGPLVTTYKLDAFGNLVSTTDPRGFVTQNVFDAKNELTETINPDGTETFTAYDPSGNVAQTTDALGNIMLFVFNSMNRQVEVVNPDNSSRFVQYAANGAVALTVDENGYTTTNAYDLAGRLISTTDANGGVTRNTYDGFGNLLETAFYPAGSITAYSATSYQYDLLNRPVESQGPQGTFQTTVYDADSNAVKQIRYNVSGYTYDPSGVSPGLINGQGQSVALSSLPVAQQHITMTTYDVLDRSVLVSAPMLAGASMPLTTATSYDAASRVLSTTDARGFITSYGYDAAGRQVSTTAPNPTNAALPGLTTASTLDADGNTLSTTDPAGNVTTDSYALKSNQLIAVTTGTQSTYTTTDANGNVVATTDGDSSRTADTYDSRNRLTSEIQPTPGGTTTYFYYPSSLLKETIDPDGRVIGYSYDALGRKTQEFWFSSAPPSSVTLLNTITWTYNSANQLASVTDNSGTTSYTYDTLGRVLTQTDANAGQPAVTYTYAYDGFGNAASQTASVGNVTVQTITSQYDADNRLIQQTAVTPGNLTAGSAATTQQVNYTLNGDGQPTTVTRYQSTAGGPLVPVATTTLAYDNDSRVTSMLHQQGLTTLDSYQYIYNNASQITKIVALVDGTTSFTYDTAGEIATAVYSINAAFNESYSFDGAGNNTVNTTTGDNRLTSDGTFSYTYDAAGNTITRTRLSSAAASDYLTLYTWDNRNRLTQVVTENNQGVVTQTVTYAYDVQNRRISETLTVGSVVTTTNFSYADDDNVALTLNASGVTTAVLYGPDNLEVSEVDATNTVRWMLADAQGSVRDVVTLSGTTAQVADHLAYNSFGKVLTETNPATPHLLGYAGQQPDAAVGLNYDQARYYNPQTGRFISQDPTGLAAGDANLYRYVFNDPVDFVDPSGLHIELPSVEDEFGGDDFDSEGLSTPSYESRPTSSESFEDYESGDDGFASSPSGFNSDYDATPTSSSSGFGTLSAAGYGSSADDDDFSKENGFDDDGFDNTPPPVGGLNNQQWLTPIFNAASSTDPELEDGEDAQGYAQSSAQYEQLKSYYAAQELLVADRTNSGLKVDANHRAASFLNLEQLATGTVFTFRGNDGVQRNLLQVLGEKNSNKGVFEYIISPQGTVVHQRFIEGGVISGIPNLNPRNLPK